MEPFQLLAHVAAGLTLGNRWGCKDVPHLLQCAQKSAAKTVD